MRERLTITLKIELLEALDSSIDGDKLRNRSHAIEHFLSKSLGLKAIKVLILAGGKPVYFESEKKSLPKAMVKIAGKPLLEHTLQKLKTAKFTEVIILIGTGGQAIQEYFGDGSKMGLNISYIKEQQPNSGTAQPVLEAKQAVGAADFLLLYGDVLSDIDFSELLTFHRAQKTAVCTMALSSSESVTMWGLCKLQGNRIVEFEEKPKEPKTFSHLVNAGIYVCEPEVFKYITAKDSKLESSVFPRLAEEGKLFGYPYDGLWLDISSSAAYKQAVRQLQNN